MLKLLLKQTLRNIGRDKFHSLINILGLGLGIACCIIGLLFVQSELNFERHHEQHERIFRYGVEMTIGGTTSRQVGCNAGAGPLLKDFIPEIEAYARIGYLGGVQVRYRENVFNEDNFLWADNDFLRIFTHPFVRGGGRDALARSNTIVLAQSQAARIFGGADPVGQELEIENLGRFQVTGVIADPLPDSHLVFSGLLSFRTQFAGQDEADLFRPSNLSGGMGYGLYFLFAPGFTAADFDKRAEQFYKKYQAAVDTIRYRSLAEPLDAIHLSSIIEVNQAAANNRFLFWFVGVVLFILFLAGVNYVNLTTSLAGRRGKEIGVRKVAGSGHLQLVGQLLSESFIFVLLAIIAGIALAVLILLLTPLNQVIGKELHLNLFSNPMLLLGLLLVWLLVGFLAGLYPAFYLSRIPVVRSLKSGTAGRAAGHRVRQALLVLQFVISIGALAMTFLMNRQLDYLQKKDLGFRKDNVVYIRVTDAALLKRIGSFREEILKYPGVESAAFSDAIPGFGYTGFAFKWETAEGEMKAFANPALRADRHYFDTMEIKLLKGRNFSRAATPGDFENRSLEIIVNETFVKRMGWKEAVGKRCDRGIVIGVVRDFNFVPLQYEMRPLFIVSTGETAPYLSIRISGRNVPETLDLLKRSWKSFSSGLPFSYSFLDQEMARVYADDLRQQKLAVIFSAICVLISCLGLFALASFQINQRTKEIGIRKTLGASLANLMLLLNRRVILWMLVSNLVSWPLAFLLMKQWLDNFAYRTGIGIGDFLLAGGVILAIALVTVSLKSLRAARANPVKSLRYE